MSAEVFIKRRCGLKNNNHGDDFQELRDVNTPPCLANRDSHDKMFRQKKNLRSILSLWKDCTVPWIKRAKDLSCLCFPFSCRFMYMQKTYHRFTQSEDQWKRAKEKCCRLISFPYRQGKRERWNPDITVAELCVWELWWLSSIKNIRA